MTTIVSAEKCSIVPISINEQGGDEPLERVNFVNQLRDDIRPTDWAFTALQNLAQRHGCLLAYPDGTYRGNRAMTRYEFAAGLDACLEQIQRQLANLVGFRQPTWKP